MMQEKKKDKGKDDYVRLALIVLVNDTRWITPFQKKGGGKNFFSFTRKKSSELSSPDIVRHITNGDRILINYDGISPLFLLL